MVCQSEAFIGDNLTFTIVTLDPTTGVLSDADAPPTYRIYEDETAAAILTGNMAILDNANTTGFYSEQIACTAGNGFEDGRSYNIYVEATVDGITGGISCGFKGRTALNDPTAAAIAAAVWTVVAEGAHTYGDIQRIVLAVLAGRATGGGTATISFRDVANTKNRVQATVDANGNRTNIGTLDGT